MDNFIFSLNATLPLFLTMTMGMLLRKIHLMNELFVTNINRFVFVVALPVLLFQDIATIDFVSSWDGGFVLFCFLTTLISILFSVSISYFLQNKEIQGEFIQASYRSSAAIFGIAFIQNLYGEVHIAPLMIIGAVPLYNVMAVIILTGFSGKHRKITGTGIKTMLFNILKNPIIIGILCGIIWSLLKIPQPVFLSKTIKNISSLATPLGLMAMGASVDYSTIKEDLKTALTGTTIKLILLPCICIPLGIYLGYRTEKLIAILVMSGSATTVSCFIMAKNMGYKGHLTSSIVMLTTLMSTFTLTVGVFTLKAFHLV